MELLKLKTAVKLTNHINPAGTWQVMTSFLSGLTHWPYSPEILIHVPLEISFNELTLKQLGISLQNVIFFSLYFPL